MSGGGESGVIELSEKHTIITLKNKGRSNREIERITGINRKTVARYWNDYQRQVDELDGDGDIRSAQEMVIEKPHYDTSSRGPIKYTPEIDKAIDDILSTENIKSQLLGKAHKQHLTCRQIHGILIEQGFDIGLTTVTFYVGEKRRISREAFIRQQYDFGDRLEYDFGEVKLVIGGVTNTYHLAAIASPASDFRWGYLYENQKKDVFLDSHVRFFEMTGKVWREVVYDNMRNVVSRFIGRNEKELNADLIKMSIYYGFDVNVTNCFSANEKGYVESTVKWIRNKIFAARYVFDTVDEARRYLALRLTCLNASSRIEEEIRALRPARPPLEIARVSEHSVNKYSFIRVDNGFYSVPDYLVGHTLTVKSYPEEIVVFSGFFEVCRHRRLCGQEVYSVDILHYLNTLATKPGAVKNSVALRSKARLKEVFEQRYVNRPKDFIFALEQLKGRPIDEIALILEDDHTTPVVSSDVFMGNIAESIKYNTQRQLAAVSAAFLRGGDKVAG